MSMDDWYRKNLGDATWADAALQELRAQFLSRYATQGPSSSAAVFVRHETAQHLYCEVMVYFSPAAAELAKAFSAEACSAPDKTDLSLLVGEEDVWQHLLFLVQETPQ